MDPEIEELKSLVRRNTELTQETHRMVRSMRNSARWSRFVHMAWWLAVLIISAYAYYFYVQPYVEQVQKMYESAQAGSRQAQTYQQQFSDFLKQFAPKQQ